MKKILTTLFFLFSLNFVYSQDFDFELIEKLTNISFYSIDNYMIEGYGFKKIREENEGKKRVYSRYYNDDFNNTIIIKVTKFKPIPKEEDGMKSYYIKPNFIEITIAKNYNLRLIKDKLLERDFEYIGKDDMGFLGYEKDKLLYLISTRTNDAGGTQIMLLKE
ncbi:hypothetical protein [Winogradskyella poriferorum]|uniref:hypothetical protein n=1 Tax=Winogradskyella poriferorum TaxID=307627 RepID=UPI003D65E975